MDWTEETISRLRDLWSQGLSTAEIGRQLSITKNAVVGKAHRLALPPRPSPIRNRPAKDGTGAEGAPRRKASLRDVRANGGERETPTQAFSAPSDSVPAGIGLSEVSGAGESSVKPAVVAQSTAASGTGTSDQSAVEAAPVAPVTAKMTINAEPESLAAVAPSPIPPASHPVASRPVPKRFQEGVDRPVRRGPSCCWPIGDPGTPGFHFCGARPLPGKPYCAEHAAIAYVKIRDRRDGGG